ncbi:MAG: hypothetical protein H0W63_01425 [Gemmatimonadaceae bacterium]|nr:hypothetical protein [Gemmatimonadaceae bacterium]
MRKCALILAVVGVIAAGACTDVTGAKNEILSIQFDSLAFPSVVVGDSLRDTTGAIALPRVTAFDFGGAVIPTATVRYYTADRGVTVDSITGLIRGDSVRATPVRIIATVGEIQAERLLSVTLRPDTMFAGNRVDSIRYSLLDTTLNLSSAVTVSLRHGVTGADSAVNAYLVSFAVVSPSGSAVADLVDEAGRKSNVDTTDTNGLAGRRIRLHATLLSSPTLNDSIVINATAKYRGKVLKGGPVRLVVRIKPRG